MKKNLILILETLLIGILAFVLCYSDYFSALNSLYKDKLYQQPRAVDSSIKIIGVDEKTLDAYGPYGTWSRQVYADILQMLGDYPAVVGFDIMFVGNMEEAGDKAFAECLTERDNIVLASHLVYSTKVEYDENGNFTQNPFHVDMVEYPYATGNASLGFANTSADSDGVVRSIVPKVTLTTENGEEQHYSFSYQVYKKYCERTGTTMREPELDDNGAQWIYYAGKPYEYECISLVDLLEGKVDARIFTNCIVLVGAYATGLQDQFGVPNSRNQMFGVEINANVVQGLLDETYPHISDRLLTSLVISLLSMGFFLLFTKLHIKWGTLIFAISEVATIVSGILLYTKGGIATPGFYLVSFLAIDYVIALAAGYLREWVAKRKIASVFRKYVAPQVVDDIMKSGKYKIRLGGETRNIAVLFVDIRGFTPLSESLEPAQVVEILNEYLNLTTKSVFANKGTLDKFIGDATMAVFNAPFDLDDYEFHAVCAAWDIVAGARALDEMCMKKFGKSVAFGVGVNCGEAVVGNIGCDFRMDYTAIGDTVNTSARLESNAKRGQVLISEYIYEKVKDRVTVNEVGEIPLKGKSKGVFVYELTGIEGKEA